MSDKPDPYRCAVCGREWCVRVLAADCCTPERIERLHRTRGETEWSQAAK